MDQALTSTLVKLALPALIIAIVLVVTRVRGISWEENLGLNRPRPSIGLARLAV